MHVNKIPEKVLVAILEKLPMKDIYTFINYDIRVYEAYHRINFYHKQRRMYRQLYKDNSFLLYYVQMLKIRLLHDSF